ncbi:hypothetical protein UVI_02045760 [Ustilaginoidea virens]|uniref:DUF3824 domain-containing protein n=1 Tax=Ustilaginoidea virens TaxID=1159556 RepID=A0A1B5L8U3_USTVR|nr:hypothetical protein UVI_02045760 [Ustilaginoidea virens]
MSRYYRDNSDSDDNHYKRTTVTRYKVAPERHSERYQRTERVEVDEDRRSKYSARNSGDIMETRGPMPDHARPVQEPYDADRSRMVFYEKDVERDNRRDPDRSRITVYETKETDREWDKRSRHGRPEEELRIEKRVEERFDDDRGYDVERYRKETEYYVPQSPPPPPVIIRQQSQEPQKIIVQDAPPAPIIVPRQQPGVVVLRDRETDREMARRDRDGYEDDYYYRYDRREVGPYRGDRERDYAMARYERHPRHDDYYSEDDEYYYRRTVRRDGSESPHHKRHLAEGALAGAGISAILSSRRDAYGDLQENRGRKVLAGAALGALGTEVARRAHSAYEERFGHDRESVDHHHHLVKKGLGVAAVALAAAGAAKYFQANKIEKEEAHRGRSRTRGYYSGGDDYSSSASPSYRVSRVSRSRSRSKRRSLSTVAKAALGTAATAGIIKHIRDKSKSKSRDRSRSRSKSRLRRAAEIGGVAAAAGVANKLWNDHKEKKDRSRDLSESGDDDYYRRRRSTSGRRRSPSGSRHRSRSRSIARSPYSQPGADPELGLVEYGTDPLYPASRVAPAPRDLDPEAEDRRAERRRRRRRDPSVSSGSDSEHVRRSRSRSRLRGMAEAGAAAIGIKEFKDRHDTKHKERRERRSRSRSIDHHRREHADASEGEASRQPPNNDDDAKDDAKDDAPTGRTLVNANHGRRSLDQTRSRPLIRKARRFGDDSPSDSDGHVESLPDRFDSQGRPLDGRSRSADHWTTRRGTFRRAPQRAGGWDVRGAWEVGGTDSEAVERLVASFTSALDGRRSWTGVLGDVLGSSLMPGIRGVQGGGSRAW